MIYRNRIRIVLALAVVAMAAVAFTASSANATSIIYEPFDDNNSSLNGNTPGLGLTGTWSSSANVQAGTLTYGDLATPTGNQVYATNQYGGVSVGTTLSSAGLLDDGATLWFSVLVRTGGEIATNGDLGFAFGTDRIGNGNNIPIANGGQALGFTFKNNQLRASYWSPALTRSGTNSGNGASPSTLYLVVGKFTWGASSDRIDIYKVAADLSLGSAVSWYTTTSNLDQSLFDTISFGSKASGTPVHLFDEIRFGATAADVLPPAVPEPATMTMLALALGGLALRFAAGGPESASVGSKIRRLITNRE